ncbi:hypothetical protein BY458DRAFT_556844 [Sporodiniella umbellata]|nr:hypothetical protein BY458DRAFT_556844 [Sporodiniella umbellata]
MDVVKVVFLVDIQCLLNEKISSEHLDLAFKRIALFYHYYYLDQQKTVFWGYRFFDSQSNYTSNTSRELYGLEEFEGLKERFDSILDKYTPTSIASNAPFMQLKQVLKELFGDFSWDVDLNFKSSTIDKSQLEKHHVYTFMTLPHNLPDLGYFFSKKRIAAKSYYATLSPASDILIDIKEDLVKTFSDSFKQRHISFNLVDADFKFNRPNTQAKLFDDFMGRGFHLSTQELHGRYVLFNSLIQDYNNYGFNFLPDMQELLLPNPLRVKSYESISVPSSQRLYDRYVLSQEISIVSSMAPPIWKGALKSFEGTRFGDVKVYPLYKDSSSLDPLTFAFCSSIEIQPSIYRSQYDDAWASCIPSDSFESDAMLSVDFDYCNGHRFLDYLASLFANHQIGIAKRVLFEGATGPSCLMCIEPMTKGCAAIRFLNIQTLPKIEPLQTAYEKDVVNIMIDKMKQVKLDEGLQAVAQDSERKRTPLNVLPSDSVLASIAKYKLQHKSLSIIDIKSKEADDEEVIVLPKNIPMFKEELEKLYYETLYERLNVLEVFIFTIDRFVKHLMEKKGIDGLEVVDIIKKLTNHRDILETKHDLKIKNAKELTQPLTRSKEDIYIHRWWRRTKEYNPELESENESRLLLKVTDARLNAILYCFMASLLKKCSPQDRNIQTYLDNASEHYEVPHYYINALDIAQRTDEVVDEVDKSDYNYLRLLETWFKNDIPELIDTLYESHYDEDLIPNPYMAGVDIAQVFKNYYSLEKESYKPKTKEKSLSALLKAEKVAKFKKMPIESRYKTVPVLPKRTPVGQLSEAATEAIDKVKRSIVNGKPTMKRAGPFLVSATSPKRKRDTHHSSKKKELDLELTPRTSLNRLLGSNVFEDYTENFLLPNDKEVDTPLSDEDEDEFNLDGFV